MRKRSVLLSLILVCALVFSGCSLFSQKSQTRPMIVYCESLSDAQLKAIGTKICAIAGVTEAEFVSQQAVYEEFMANVGTVEAFSDVDASYLRPRYLVTVEVEAFDTALEQIRRIEGVEEVRI